MGPLLSNLIQDFLFRHSALNGVIRKRYTFSRIILLMVLKYNTVHAGKAHSVLLV